MAIFYDKSNGKIIDTEGPGSGQIELAPSSPNVGTALVSSTGVVLGSSGIPLSSSRVSTGYYEITFDASIDLYAIFLSINEPYSTRDSIHVRYEARAPGIFRVHTTEGDNGTTANTPRDREFCVEIKVLT